MLRVAGLQRQLLMWLHVFVPGMQVCFYKLDGAPSGRVSFSSCSENRECWTRVLTRCLVGRCRQPVTAGATLVAVLHATTRSPSHTIWLPCPSKPAPDMTLKHTHRPAAVGVTFHDLRPQPIPLQPGSPRSLFNSVFYFHSTLNRTEDWTWPSDATPKSMDHWIVADARTALGRHQLWVPEDKLADGWYNLRVGGRHKAAAARIGSADAAAVGRQGCCA